MRLDEWIRAATAALSEAGVDSPQLDAQLLAAHHLGQSRSWILVHPEYKIDRSELQLLLDRRLNREPLAYILGRKEFFGRQFFVNPSVLIPRPETEELVTCALDWIKNNPFSRVLDVGCGSGCIGLSIKVEQPETLVTLSDISYEALQVARMNADVHDVRCEFVESNLFQAFKKYKFDLIVSNPPYIAPNEELMPEIAEFEPKTALYAEEDGFQIYSRIAEEALTVRPKAIMLEIGRGQETRIDEIFRANEYKLHESRKDLSGIVRILTFVPIK